jgi:dTDP-4-dehydrorhamnose 3,5-epimerase
MSFLDLVRGSRAPGGITAASPRSCAREAHSQEEQHPRQRGILRAGAAPADEQTAKDSRRLLKITPVPRIDGALLFRPAPHPDERGFFSRTFDAQAAQDAGIDPAGFAQDSQSRSARGVIRGLHLRGAAGEAKLIRCSYGAIFDVIIDLRAGSPTYRNWESFELTDTQQVSLYVPAGCAHGFQALTDPADVAYRIDREHDPAEDISIAFDDPDLAIPWPLPVTVMSPRDRAAPPLAAALKQLDESLAASSPSPATAP